MLFEFCCLWCIWPLTMAAGIVAAISRPAAGIAFIIDIGIQVIGIIYLLIVQLALYVRRLHDTGKSGWWCLLGLLPFAGAAVLLVFAMLDPAPGPNRYG